jgi:SulP family sulfate permease
MAEKHEFVRLLRAGDTAAMLLATFLLTVFRDLAEGIVVGFALGALLFIHRMTQTPASTRMRRWSRRKADTSNGDRGRYDSALATDSTSWSIASPARSSSARSPPWRRCWTGCPATRRW